VAATVLQTDAVAIRRGRRRFLSVWGNIPAVSIILRRKKNRLLRGAA